MKRLTHSLLFFLLLLAACSGKQPKKKNPDPLLNPNYKEAINFRNAGDTDSAFIYFNTAREGFTSDKDSLGLAKCLINMAIIQSDKGDLFGGIEISLSAIPLLNEKDKDHWNAIHSNYNNLAISSYKLRNYGDALKFYNLALRYATEKNDKLLYLNNKAKTLEETKNYDAALKIYALVFNNADKDSDPYAKALANLATTKWLQNSHFDATTGLSAALNIYKQNKDLFGQNYCYARLSDYYSEKNNALAISYAQHMYQVATDLNSPADKLEALYKLIKLTPSRDSKRYFTAYEKLDDSLQLARAKARNQFALIRYDTLKLQKDNAEKKYQLIRQQVILFGTIAIVLLAAISSVFWYRKRKKQHEQEKELEVKKTELKYVKKVHDRLANKLYNLMMEVLHAKRLDQNALADRIEPIYEMARDISYENKEAHQVHFSRRLSAMLDPYLTAGAVLQISGNKEALWTGINHHIRSEIWIVLQELFTNMSKHSKASIVQLDFERTEDQLHITYKDNGIGMPGKPVYKNGLNNTETRIAELRGTINFDTTVSRGLKITLSIPVS